MAHWLRRDAHVLVVGVGGGRDVLSALAFGQRDVVGVEINGAILDVVNAHFGGFTGRLDRDPRVTFVNDEARSYIARQRQPVDILQISLIDTWAATGAGAFVLSEHSLYTSEAWELFLDRLTPHGLLSVSRWYYDSRPDETYRVTSLAVAALARRGVTHPREHMAIVRHATGADGRMAPLGVATLLVSPSPLSRRRRGRPGGGGAPPALRRHPLAAPSRRADVRGAHQRAGPRGPLRAVPGEHRAAHRQQPVLLPHPVVCATSSTASCGAPISAAARPTSRPSGCSACCCSRCWG